MNADHVQHDTKTGQMYCGHCGFRQALKMPAPIDGILSAMDAFLAAHKSCKAEPGVKPLLTDDIQYIAGFDHGCDYVIHEIEQYTKKVTSHDALVLVELVKHLKGKPE